jgi:hypothetical protein
MYRPTLQDVRLLFAVSVISLQDLCYQMPVTAIIINRPQNVTSVALASPITGLYVIRLNGCSCRNVMCSLKYFLYMLPSMLYCDVVCESLLFMHEKWFLRLIIR